MRYPFSNNTTTSISDNIYPLNSTTDTMSPASTQAFRAWLKGNVNMKLQTDAAVTCIMYEGINNYKGLADLDTKSIQQLPTCCRQQIDEVHQDLNLGIQQEH